MSSGNSDTRRRILQSCWDLMVETGGVNVRMSDIAKRANVSRQALYLHFDTRADLYVATTQFMDEELNASINLLNYLSAHDPLDQIRLFVSAWAGHMENIQHVARSLLAAGVTDDEALHAWNDRMALLHGRCLDIVGNLKAAGHLRDGLSAKRAAELFVVTISFQNWDRMRHHFGWSNATYIKLVTDQIKAGITSQTIEGATERPSQ